MIDFGLSHSFDGVIKVLGAANLAKEFLPVFPIDFVFKKRSLIFNALRLRICKFGCLALILRYVLPQKSE